ncbi:hypothetical protein N9182_01280 [bacterium]|nr:hypothetical protein [bacterium]
MKPQFTHAFYSRLVLICSMGLLPLASSGQLLTWEGDQDENWNTDNAGDTNWSADSLPMAGNSPAFLPSFRPTPTR